jgi:hypothetical protein
MFANKISHVLAGGLHKLFSHQSQRLQCVSLSSGICSNMAYSIVERGSPYSPDYRVYIRKS